LDLAICSYETAQFGKNLGNIVTTHTSAVGQAELEQQLLALSSELPQFLLSQSLAGTEMATCVAETSLGPLQRSAWHKSSVRQNLHVP